MRRLVMSLVLMSLVAVCAAAEDDAPTMASVLAEATASDWQLLDQSNLLYLFLDDAVVVFEMARSFAPEHIANIETLVEQRYFDGLAIVRSQDNYVVQWGDPAAGTGQARTLGAAATTLEPEFFRDFAGLSMVVLDSRDAYAPQVGFAAGMPVGTDGERAWLAHCYGMLGAGRATEPDSGNGAELYVVTGHSPRHLDRNVTLIGRTVYGIEQLSSLPRGRGALGFYESDKDRVPIVKIRFGDELPPDERIALRRLRTDTRTFADLIEARRNRLEDWFVDPAGHIELCNVPIPVEPVGQ